MIQKLEFLRDPAYT